MEWVNFFLTLWMFFLPCQPTISHHHHTIGSVFLPIFCTEHCICWQLSDVHVSHFHWYYFECFPNFPHTIFTQNGQQQIHSMCRQGQWEFKGKVCLNVTKNCCRSTELQSSVSAWLIWWLKKFQQGLCDFSMKKTDGHVSKVTQELIDRIRDMLEENDTMGIRVITRTGLSLRTVHQVICNWLNLRKCPAKWTLHLLSDNQKLKRLQTSQALLARFCRTPNLHQRVIKGDKSWFYCYEPRMKRSTSAQLWSNEEWPQKPVRDRYVCKVMLTAFFGQQMWGSAWVQCQWTWPEHWQLPGNWKKLEGETSSLMHHHLEERELLSPSWWGPNSLCCCCHSVLGIHRHKTPSPPPVFSWLSFLRFLSVLQNPEKHVLWCVQQCGCIALTSMLVKSLLGNLHMQQQKVGQKGFKSALTNVAITLKHARQLRYQKTDFWSFLGGTCCSLTDFSRKTYACF